jgi:hypothetical protein
MNSNFVNSRRLVLMGSPFPRRNIYKTVACFGESCCLHCHGDKRWKQQVPPTLLLISTRLHDVMFQNTTILISTVTETWNLIDGLLWTLLFVPCTCVYLGFEVLPAVVMKTSVFWDKTLCSLLKVYRLFGETSPPSSGSKNKRNKKPA